MYNSKNTIKTKCITFLWLLVNVYVISVWSAWSIKSTFANV